MSKYRIREKDNLFIPEYENCGVWVPVGGGKTSIEEAQFVIDKHSSGSTDLNEVIHNYSPNTKKILLG